MAEAEGFEPPRSRDLPVFKTGAFSQALPRLRGGQGSSGRLAGHRDDDRLRLVPVEAGRTRSTRYFRLTISLIQTGAKGEVQPFGAW